MDDMDEPDEIVSKPRKRERKYVRKTKPKRKVTFQKPSPRQQAAEINRNAREHYKRVAAGNFPKSNWEVEPSSGLKYAFLKVGDKFLRYQGCIARWYASHLDQ